MGWKWVYFGLFLLILFGGGGFGGWGYGRGANELINDASISGTNREAALAKAQAAGLSDSTLLTAMEEIKKHKWFTTLLLLTSVK